MRLAAIIDPSYTVPSSGTMYTDEVCNFCDTYFSVDEWDIRHEGEWGDSIHEACCDIGGPCRKDYDGI